MAGDRANRRLSIFEKVMRRVRIADMGWKTPCWLWMGPLSGKGRGHGYGRMSLDGQTVAVHLVMFCHFFGFIPGKKQVDHLCKVRNCCYPDHLELVTHKQNMARRDAK